MVRFSTVGLRLVVPSTVLRVGVALTSNGKLQVHMTPVSTFFLNLVFLFMSLCFL